MRTLQPGYDPLASHVRQWYFAEIFFRGRRLENAVLIRLTLSDHEDMDGALREAMLANEQDEVKALFRYLLRVYKCRFDRNNEPHKGGRIIDYVPRGEEGKH